MNLKDNLNSNLNVPNLYIPEICTVNKIIKETSNIISLQITIDDKEKMEKFKFQPGQVGQLSVFGYGESTFVINSSPSCSDFLQFTVMKTGVTTAAIHNLSEDEKVGLRAPLGNWFPYKDMEGKNILLVGGGIGLAPLRPLLLYMLENRNKYKKLTLLYGTKTPEDICFKYDIEDWEKSDGIEVFLTIDTACYGWEKEVGLCPDVLEKLAPSSDNTVAITCGPPIMIKYVLRVLEKLGFEDGSVYTTLERRMKCGIGKCGRCNLGEKFVCVDGPVFTLKELKNLSESSI
ncbi:MAG: FAD/NAD(P)-binding protein [Actinobacteria bacterium]|nr:FAD/NAD(P)-binding protein [Actinomycetota bacterium]